MKTLIRNMRTVTALIFLSSCFFGMSEQGEGNYAKTTLTLDTALKLASERHYRLAESRARLIAAEHRAVQAGLRPNPKLIAGTESLGFSRSRLDQADYIVGISQELRGRSKARLTQDVAEAEREREMHRYEMVSREVEREVHGAFATALHAQSSILLSSERIRILETRLALAQALAESGETTPEIRDRAHADLDHEQLDHNEMKGLRTKAFTALATAIGYPDLDIAGVEGDLTSILGMKALRQWVTQLDQLPEIQAAQAELKVHELRSKLMEASRIPSVNVGLLYRRSQGMRQDGMDLQASLSIPLFDNKKSAVSALNADARAAEARARGLREDLTLSVTRLGKELELALQRVEHERDEILPHQEQLVERQTHLYEAGESGLLGVLDEKWILSEMKSTHLEALRDVHELWIQMQQFKTAGNMQMRP